MRFSWTWVPRGHATAGGLVAVAFLACGGSTASVGTTPDASLAPEGGTGDATTMTDAGLDDGPLQAEGGSDAARVTDAATKCADLGTRAMCVACCDARTPAGSSAFGVALNACACQADLCGPFDAGAPSDGGVGTGACTAECKNGGKAGGSCTSCRDETLVEDGGACYPSVKSACEHDPACVAYVACLETCPAK